MPVLDSPRRSQAERRDEAESRLITAALRIVAERGIERLTLAEVGVAAGYSRGLPAHYFNSKSGLIVRLAQHVTGEFALKLMTGEKHKPGLDRLMDVVRLYFDTARKNQVETRALLVLLGAGLNNETIGRELAEVTARSVAEIEADLVAAVRARSAHPEMDTKAQATLILATLRGTISQWLMSPRSVDLARLRNEMITALLRSLKR